MNSKNLIQIANSKLLKVTERPDIVMSKGQGMYLTDIENNSYLDFIGGWAVNCLGHSPKAISDILLDEKIVENCMAMGQILLTRLNELADQYELKNIRGKGLLMHLI